MRSASLKHPHYHSNSHKRSQPFAREHFTSIYTNPSPPHYTAKLRILTSMNNNNNNNNNRKLWPLTCAPPSPQRGYSANVSRVPPLFPLSTGTNICNSSRRDAKYLSGPLNWRRSFAGWEVFENGAWARYLIFTADFISILPRLPPPPARKGRREVKEERK